MFTISRRGILKSAASAMALGSGISAVGVGGALAAETINGVTWGGDWGEATNAVTAKQSLVNVNWQLYSGPASVFLTKIKAMGARPNVDLIAAFDATYPIVAQEGLGEPVTPEKVPNIVDIPQTLLVKDGAGNVINVPTSIGTFCWFYREDLVPFQITKLDDLLDPRLKGKICFPIPTAGGNTQMLSIALYKGGDEKNLDPAWDFVKKLASSGNIGRVFNSDVELTNSIVSGETAIGWAPTTDIVKFSSKFKIRFLMKMDPSTTGFRAFVFSSGWCVVKGGKTDAALKLANYFISPEGNTLFCNVSHGLPANPKASVSDEKKPFMWSSEEMDKYAYLPDWTYLGKQKDASMKRWEQEIQPLL
ncbi:extracellular solute-binding protein [Bradyrhizobium sp. CNPSo 4010]|uniref:Extracellular solute-binding protein n=1 Tax=Bradyrhizobium agreste TaxID=2751811 RepID=A0ABS0PGE1_9BRAD|nr:extracellular solute-binding protein [Bradyrhizobium agreste]MBH5396268.1 extracellular solute-binding protein [Bradyrhizobium agreste]